MSSGDTCVTIGAAFENLEVESDREKVKKKRDAAFYVKDKQGRRRFHGAFTGGFSAGYYNTVGTEEGEVFMCAIITIMCAIENSEQNGHAQMHQDTHTHTHTQYSVLTSALSKMHAPLALITLPVSESPPPSMIHDLAKGRSLQWTPDSRISHEQQT